MKRIILVISSLVLMTIGMSSCIVVPEGGYHHHHHWHHWHDHDRW